MVDRRNALKLLAAGGAATAASSVVSSPVFADGASPPGANGITVSRSNPAVSLTPQFGPTNGPGGFPNVVGAVQGNFTNGWSCDAAGATRSQQIRYAILGQTGTPMTITPSANLGGGGWTATNRFFFTFSYIAADGQTSVAGSTFTVRVQVRLLCCGPGGQKAWRCFQVSGTASLGNGSATTSNTNQTSSLDCENPIPSCP